MGKSFLGVGRGGGGSERGPEFNKYNRHIDLARICAIITLKQPIKCVEHLHQREFVL